MQNDKPLCGFLNLLKPPGMTSAAAVAMVRRLMGGVKIGHAGTLDPEASGVLPLMLGKAARLFDYMQDKEKAYITEIAFTGSTDTEDAQGVLLRPGTVPPGEAELQAVLPRFRGEILQRPPIFSALKQGGEPLYKLARKGKAPELPARPVTVHSLELLSMTERSGALLSVHCSKGFYVRSLCRDIGEALGCPSHMRFLLRTQSGVFTLETSRTPEELARAAGTGALAELLIPPEAALPHLPVCEAPAGLEKAIRNGGNIPWAAFEKLKGTSAEEGRPFFIRMDGAADAVAERREGAVKVRTWLAD